MNDETYNGWKNYETWAAFSWLTNDEKTYNTVLEHIAAAKKVISAPAAFATLPASTQATLVEHTVADAIENYVQTLRPYYASRVGLMADLLGAALGRINYHELAKTFLE